MRQQAETLDGFIRDRKRTGVAVVALPEEMPVNETVEMQDKLVDAVGVDFSAVIVNGLYPERFSRAEVDRISAVAASVDGARAGMLVTALAEDDRARLQRSYVRRLKKEIRAPVHTLPFLFEPELGLAEYHELARRLAKRL